MVPNSLSFYENEKFLMLLFTRMGLAINQVDLARRYFAGYFLDIVEMINIIMATPLPATGYLITLRI